MTVGIVKRRYSVDGDLTILMTLTSTQTLSSMPSSLEIPKSTKTTTSKQHSSRGSSRSMTKSRVSTKSSQDDSLTLFPIPSTLVSKYTQKNSDKTSEVVHTTHTSSPISSGVDNMAGISSGNKSLKLGLAIGIPIGLISILIAIILGWYYLKKKAFNKRSNALLPYQNKYFDHSKNEKLTMQETRFFRPASLNLISTKFSTETPVQIHDGPKQQIHRNSVKNFFNRLSRTINIKNINDLDMGSMHENRGGLMSPIFLKKFNLNKPVNKPSDIYKEDKRFDRTNGFINSVDSQFLSIPYNASKIEVIERPSKPLPKLPPIINTYQTKSLHDMENVITKPLILKRNDETDGLDKLYTVIKSYRRNLPDEISIKVGDQVILLTEHSDGWCLIDLINGNIDYQPNHTRRQGVVPKLCLQKI